MALFQQSTWHQESVKGVGATDDLLIDLPGLSFSSSSSSSGGGGELLAVTINNSSSSSATTLQNSTTTTSRRRYHQHRRYYGLVDEIKSMLGKQDPETKTRPSYSAYTKATVVKEAPWLSPNRRMCKETCCVSTVAVSLEQDQHKLINTQDGYDLADIIIKHDVYGTVDGRPEHKHLRYHASIFDEAIIPCLLPGTIITVENYRKLGKYFWNNIRPEMKYPYMLLTTGTDDFSPSIGREYIEKDPLLLRWYGTNPFYHKRRQKQQFNNDSSFHGDTFQPLPLGFSYQHGQERHILPYLQLNKYTTNPFRDKSRWLDLVFENEDSSSSSDQEDAVADSNDIFNFERDVYINFGLKKEHRRRLWKVLCPNTNTTTNSSNTSRSTPLSSSCYHGTKMLPLIKIYADMSRYKFGISPPGAGWDCYRTYELLAMGVIPIIEERDSPVGGESYDLFKGLPVIHMPNMSKAANKQQFVDVIQNYIKSESFQNATYGEDSWGRFMFLHHRRQKLLHETGRDKEVVVDENGSRYYQAYQYEYFPRNSSGNENIYCEHTGNCEPLLGKKVDKKWLQQPPEISKEDETWLARWKQQINAVE